MDRSGKMVKDEMRAAGTAVVASMLRRQGVNAIKIKKIRSSGSITDKDITLFTRQFATMMKSGVPLLQAFDVVGKDAAIGRWAGC
jgi:type IV pilus assembly protein PilC